MEKWKIGVISALIFALLGYGIYSNGQDDSSTEKIFATNTPTSNNSTPVPEASPTPLRYVGMSIDGGKQLLPEWKNITQWMNTTHSIPLASLKGQIALIEVFRTQCSHCQEAAPLMEKLYQRYQPRGLKMVALESPANYNSDNPETRWNEIQVWVKANNLNYPVGYDVGSQWFQKNLKGDLYPTMLVLNKNGGVGFASQGFNSKKFVDLAIALEKLLPTKQNLSQRAKDLATWIYPLLYAGQPLDTSAIEGIAKRFEEQLK